MVETGNSQSEGGDKTGPTSAASETPATDGTGENVASPASASTASATNATTSSEILAAAGEPLNVKTATPAVAKSKAENASEGKDLTIPATPPVTPVSSGDQPSFPLPILAPVSIQPAVSTTPSTDPIAPAIPAGSVHSDAPTVIATPENGSEATAPTGAVLASSTSTAGSVGSITLSSPTAVIPKLLEAAATVASAPVTTSPLLVSPEAIDCSPTDSGSVLPDTAPTAGSVTYCTPEPASPEPIAPALCPSDVVPAVPIFSELVASVVTAPAPTLSIPPEGANGDSGSNEAWNKRESELMITVSDLEKAKIQAASEAIKLKLKAKDDEIELLKARVKTLETELTAALTRPGARNHELVETIKQQHEELLSRARGMIFDKTKIVKNQELQIAALAAQVASLKDVNSITKDLLEIRNSEIKHLEERMECMEGRFKAEKERHMLVLKRAEAGQSINNDLRTEYETQLKLFKELREKYDQRVQALIAENKRISENAAEPSSSS